MKSSFRSVLSSIVLNSMLMTAPAMASAPVATAASVAAPDRVIQEIRLLLHKHYVLPELRPALDAKLVRALRTGRYRTTDPNLLAERVNADLEAVVHDRHLNLRFAPDDAAQLMASNAGKAPIAAPGDAVEAARRRNHGIVSMRVVDGNIRYVRIDSFVWSGDESRAAYDVAMRFLADGDAVIIDLRQNGGGNGAASNYLTSHFVAQRTPLMTFYLDGKPVEDVLATSVAPKSHMLETPLYVLTSGRSASAAEEFIGVIGALRRGELIGEKTAGAGFNNELYPVADSFVLSVSVGRAEIIKTRQGWEKTGIAPTLPMSAAQALETAQARALERLAEKETDPGRRVELQTLAKRAAIVGARVTPTEPLAAYAGAFGQRTIVADGGRLLLQRAGSAPVRLIPLGGNQFTFEDDLSSGVEVRVVDGAATAIILTRLDGARLEVPRSG